MHEICFTSFQDVLLAMCVGFVQVLRRKRRNVMRICDKDGAMYSF